MKLPGRFGGKKKTNTKRNPKRGRHKKSGGPRITSLTWILVAAIVVLVGGIGFLKWANSGTGQATLLTMGSDQAFFDVQNRIESVLVGQFPNFRPGAASGESDLDWPAAQLGTRAYVRCRLVAVPVGISYESIQLALAHSLKKIGGCILWGQKIYPQQTRGDQRQLNSEKDLLRLDIGVSGKPTHTLVLHRDGMNPALIWGDQAGPSAWDQFRAKCTGPVVALVIDDWGHTRNQATRGLLKLPIPLTMAVLPNLPFSRQFSLENTELAFPCGGETVLSGRESLPADRTQRLAAGCFVELRLGKKQVAVPRKRREVILHLPMEPQGYPGINPGVEPLLIGMDQATISQLLDDKLKNLPGIRGLNNHMGSAATSDPATMRALMEVLRKKGLFFLDSLTSANSVANGMAREAGVPTLRNRIFLDYDSENEETITANLNLLIRSARNKGFALGIGHPHVATLNVLAREIPKLQADGICFVTVSEMMALMRPNYSGVTP